jgi:hypothetical protein
LYLMIHCTSLFSDICDRKVDGRFIWMDPISIIFNSSFY